MHSTERPVTARPDRESPPPLGAESHSDVPRLHLEARREPRGELPMTLARMTGEFLDLACRLADTDPADQDDMAEIRTLLDGSAAAIEEKSASIAALIRELEARASAAQSEAERILAHARTAGAHAAWLRAYLLANLQALGVERIVTATTRILVRQSPPAVELTDEEQVPEEFKRIVRSIDKAALRAALLEGQAVAGARLSRDTHLIIR